jgi:hypothetical protein
MLDLAAFESLVTEIEGQGIDLETACQFASLIGDCPCVDELGRIVVTDNDGRELARLKLSFFHG